MAIRRNSTSAAVNNPASTTPRQYSMQRGRPRQLKDEKAVVEDIIDTADGDFNNYPDVEPIAAGIIQYVPDRKIQWPSANALRTEIASVEKDRKIKAEKDRAERIANAVGSAVVVLPTTGRAQFVMGVICLGSTMLLITRRPWADEGLFTLNGLVDSFIFTSLAVISGYVLIKMMNAKAAAKGAARGDTGIPTP
jgi:hypothetical protein